MNIEILEEKWKSLKPENNGNILSLRISAECVPDLLIGLDSRGTRCLILSLPTDYVPDFQSVYKQNLSIELFKDARWIILKLSNAIYIDLFNDLILSLYNKIKDISVAQNYVSLFIETFYKWSDFFDETQVSRLSEETIKGILGEVLFLKELIKQNNPALINDILLSWKGLYDTGHDFILNDKNIEVKTKETSALDIRISSEFQLEPESEKPLQLVVVNVQKDNGGSSLSDELLNLKKIVIERLGDFTLILKSLSQKGLTMNNISEYDNYKYFPIEIGIYDCTREEFPKIIFSNLPRLVNSVKYNIRIGSLDEFRIQKIEINGA